MRRYSEADLLELEGQFVIIEGKNGRSIKGILSRSTGPWDWVVVTRVEDNLFGRIITPVYLDNIRKILVRTEHAEQNKDNATRVIRKGRKRGFEVGFPFFKYKSEKSEEIEER